MLVVWIVNIALLILYTFFCYLLYDSEGFMIGLGIYYLTIYIFPVFALIANLILVIFFSVSSLIFWIPFGVWLLVLFGIASRKSYILWMEKRAKKKLQPAVQKVFQTYGIQVEIPDFWVYWDGGKYSLHVHVSDKTLRDKLRWRKLCEEINFASPKFHLEQVRLY